MKRLHIHTVPERDGATDFEDFYDAISRDWQHKAEALQARRWRKLKQEITSDER